MIIAPIQEFRKKTDEQLYGVMGDCQSPGNYQLAVEELQRRYLEKVGIAVGNLTDSSCRLERLTRWLIGLTVSLLVLAVLQVIIVIKWG